MRTAVMACALTVLSVANRSAAADAPGRVIAVLQDFEDEPPHAIKPLEVWRWTEAEKARAPVFSSLSVTNATPPGSHCFRVRIDPSFPWEKGVPPLLMIGRAYFPPEADAIRMRVKVLSGRFTLTVGGPTAYYGNSDAFARTVTVAAQAEPAWETVTFSLNQRLWRNYRRAGYSAEAPRIYYTRWAQEPTALQALSGSQGEMLVDDVELLALGEGRPFPVFDPKDVEPIGAPAGFEDAASLGSAFTILMADNQDKEFELSWTRNPAPRYPPPLLSLAEEGASGRHALCVRARFSEEILWAGLKVAPSTDANALRVTAKLQRDGNPNTVAGLGPGEPIDFAVFVAPTDPPFPWERFAPSAALRAAPARGFDYNLTYVGIRNQQGFSFACYHARRYVPRGEWTALVIPFSDFTCFYGHGAYAERLQGQQPLTGGDVIAVACLAPFPRQAHVDTTILVDDVGLAKVRSTEGDGRSFWQVPDISRVHLWKDPQTSTYGGIRHMLPAGETSPDGHAATP